MTQFTDLYLRAPTRAALDAAFEAAGLSDSMPGVEFDRLPCPFHKLVGYQEDGEPILATFDEYHCNVRLTFALTPEQADVLNGYLLPAPGEPFRRWA